MKRGPFCSFFDDMFSAKDDLVSQISSAQVFPAKDDLVSQISSAQVVDFSEDESFVDCGRLTEIMSKPTSECSQRELAIRSMELNARLRNSSKERLPSESSQRASSSQRSDQKRSP